MKVFAKDSAVVSIDADPRVLPAASKQGSPQWIRSGPLNVGVAEANMMLIGEAFRGPGFRIPGVSTFCPFFDWKVLRRIAVGAQERQEAIRGSGRMG